MDDALQSAAYEGLSVELAFNEEGPTFGDLFLLVGDEHPRFPPSKRFPFRELERLGFMQMDDYFGIPNQTDEGDDVIVWLFPVVHGEVVDHHPGPFHALRLEYSVLRNTESTLDTFLGCVEVLSSRLDVQLLYATRDVELATIAAVKAIRSDAQEIAAHWRAQGIAPGSREALQVD